MRSGLDALRAMACGAQGVFCGRAFLYALAAWGDEGGAQFATMIHEEFAVAMAQSGAWRVAAIPQVTSRHGDAYRF